MAFSTMLNLGFCYNLVYLLLELYISSFDAVHKPCINDLLMIVDQLTGWSHLQHYPANMTTLSIYIFSTPTTALEPVS